MQVDHALDDMPDLLPAGYPDSDDDTDSTEHSDMDLEEDSGNEADDEEALDEQRESRPRVARYVRSEIEQMYSRRYEEPRDEPISHPPPQMPHVLEVLKVERPDHFREILRVSPGVRVTETLRKERLGMVRMTAVKVEIILESGLRPAGQHLVSGRARIS